MSSGIPLHRLNLTTVTVAVVDDNHNSFTIIRSSLRGFGVGRVTHFAESESAMSGLLLERADVVIVDFHLVPVSGLDVVTQIRRSAIANTRILMMASDPSRKMVMTARDHGVDEFISKPVLPEVLWWRLYSMINNQRNFVESPHYIGPCRRRKTDPLYNGVRRRADEAAGGDQMMSETAVQDLMRSLIGG